VSLYQKQEKHTEAEPLFLRALKIDEAYFGPNHPKVAIRLSNLALLYHLTRRLKDAESLYERALKIYEKNLGKDHPDTKTIRDNIELLRTTE